MKKAFLIIFLILTIWGGAPGQTGFIPLSLDHALFRGAGNQVYLEIYLSFYETYLQYLPREGQLTAEYFAAAEIIQDDSILTRKIDRRISQIDSLTQPNRYRKFLNVFGFYLQPGMYAAKVQVQDLNSNKMGEYIFEFQTTHFATDTLSLSDIQLCSRLAPDTARGEFQKNSYLTIPNPENTYSIGSPILYYYAELYNLKYATPETGSYSVHCTISDLDGSTIKEYPKKEIKKPGESAVLVGGYNVVTLDNATYLLNLAVRDDQTGQQVRKLKTVHFLPSGITKRYIR